MGVEAVAGPGSATQVVEDRRLAVHRNDHVGVVDRPPIVAIPLEHRRRHQRYGWTGFPPELDVGETAEESEIHLAVSQLIERLAGDEPDWLAERIAHPGSDEMIGRPDARSEKCGEDQLGRLAHGSTPLRRVAAIGGWSGRGVALGMRDSGSGGLREAESAGALGWR